MAENEGELTQQAEEQQLKILAEGQGEAEPAGSASSPSPLEVIPCQEGEPPCADPYWTPPSLATLQFTQSQEEAIQKVVGLSEGSRDRVLERLWQRALARLITEEAEQVLREADTE
jgi:hypothetical protein